MVEWFKPSEKMPEDNQECLLMPTHVFDPGMTTVPVVGPIPWVEHLGCWMDLFATPEAGTMVTRDQVGLWTDWAAIEPNIEEGD